VGPPQAARDPGRRLTFFGVVAVGLGLGLVGLGLLHPLLPMLSGALGDQRPIDSQTVWMGLLLYVSLGAAMIWAGVGSIRRRRWVRPIMLFLCGTWLIVGVFVLLLVLWIVDDVLLATGGELVRSSPAVATAARWVALGVTFLGGVLLPIVFILAYRGPEVQAACERHDTRPSWSDRCPSTVLVLSIALLAAGLLSLPMVFRPVVPLFGRLATGRMGLLALIGGIALCIWLAWSTYRLERAGWWATLVFLVLLGVSTVWTFEVVDMTEVYRQLGYPDEQITALARSEPLLLQLTLWGTVALTVAGVAYMLGVRRHFFGPKPSQT
jgi:hypothetical protein